jgi:hypothetical protein
MTTIGRTAAFKAQPKFPVDAEIKIGKSVWSDGVAGSRFYAKVLSKNPATVQKAIDLAGELNPPFSPSAVQGHLRWLYTAGELEVDGKSYAATKSAPVVQAKPGKQTEAKAATKPEAAKTELPKVKKPKVKAMAARKSVHVRTKKAA